MMEGVPGYWGGDDFTLPSLQEDALRALLSTACDSANTYVRKRTLDDARRETAAAQTPHSLCICITSDDGGKLFVRHDGMMIGDSCTQRPADIQLDTMFHRPADTPHIRGITLAEFGRLGHDDGFTRDTFLVVDDVVDDDIGAQPGPLGRPKLLVSVDGTRIALSNDENLMYEFVDADEYKAQLQPLLASKYVLPLVADPADPADPADRGIRRPITLGQFWETVRSADGGGTIKYLFHLMRYMGRRETLLVKVEHPY